MSSLATAGMGATTYNPQLPGTTANQWAVQLLNALNIPPTAANVRLLVGWATAESGGGSSTACAGRYNPLNSTEGSQGFVCQGGSQGNIKGYANVTQGVANIAHDLNGPSFGYPAIVAALRSGNQQAFIDAVGNSQWGTSGALLAQTLGGSAPAAVPTETTGGTGSSSSATDTSGEPCLFKLPSVSGPFGLGSVGGQCLVSASAGRALLGAVSLLAGVGLMALGVALMASSSKAGKAITRNVPLVAAAAAAV